MFEAAPRFGMSNKSQWR